MECKAIKNFKDCEAMSLFYNDDTNKYLGFEKKSPTQIDKLFSTPNWYGFIVSDNNKPVGVFNLRVSQSGFEAEFGIVVGYKFQGKGYGNEIMDLLEEEAKKLNISVIKLHVFEKNIKAINLYNKKNYKEKHKEIIMEKIL